MPSLAREAQLSELVAFVDEARYAAAGVDIDAGNRMVELIKPLVRATAPRRAGRKSAVSAGCSTSAAGFTDPILVAATDGVGTKVKIAIETCRHDTIGIDLVAMSVNDLVVQGAEPLFFLDYFACGKLDRRSAPWWCKASRRRAARPAARSSAAKPRRCPASMRAAIMTLPALPSAPSDALTYWRATSRGRCRGRARLDGRAFERLFARPPRGRQCRSDLGQPGAVRALAQLGRGALDADAALCASCLAAIRTTKAVKALAHITGGGFTENIPRVLPQGLGVSLELGAVPVLPVFKWLAAAGDIGEKEMLRTFNCGIGMIAVLDRAGADVGAAECLAKNGETVVRLGEVVAGGGVEYRGHLDLSR